MENPEKIEIEGLKTIHKLCKFGAEHNMKGCSFTEIVERMFVELVKAKADAVPEGFVLVPKEPIQLFKEKLEDYLFDLWTGDHGCDWDGFLSADAVEHGVLWKMMLEAQEPSHD